MNFIIIYSWVLSIIGAFFLGNEIAMMKMDKEMREVYEMRISDNDKLEKCHRLLTEFDYKDN